MSRTKTKTPTPSRIDAQGPGRRPSLPAQAGRGQGDELQQQAAKGQPLLTSNQGLVLGDNQNSLRGGERGPTLLEDFLLREKITHFDHERIPERIVHARGSAAHGYFECTRDCSDWTRAAFLGKRGRRTPSNPSLITACRRRPRHTIRCGTSPR